MKKITHHVFIVGLITIIAVPSAAFGSAINEVSYSSIKETRGDTILIEHKGPGTEQFSQCSLSAGTCEQVSAGAHLFPPILGNHSYETSQDGTLAVYTMVQPTAALHFLYTIEEENAVLQRLLPFNDQVTRLRFSDNGSYIIAATVGGDLVRYNVDNNSVSRMTTTQRTFPFFQVSPRGTYVSAYNYSFGEHRLWNLQNQTVTSIKATEPAFVEFNESEDEIAFIAQGQDGHTTLTTISLPYNPNAGSASKKELTRGTTVRDYLYLGNDLYVLDNHDGFYSYDLFSIEANGERARIAENVSYGEYIREVNNQLLFVAHDDARTIAKAYNPADNTLTQLTSRRSPATLNNITRTAVEHGGRNAVLWEPKRNANGTLFVWLHGGPKRQTSLDYHPYLSYAVYDAVLANLVNSGARVLRLDYTGSEGYTSQDQERLVGNIGKVEVSDIVNATEAQLRQNNIDNVHLIGNSYGGYLALRAITERPDLFNSAISVNGVTNWYTLLTAIPDSLFARYFNGAPDLHNLEQYFNASVFSDLPKVSDDTPILLIYGENDTTIPPSQSINYHAYAQTLGKNTTLAGLPGESHILRESSNLQRLCNVIAGELDLSGVQCN